MTNVSTGEAGRLSLKVRGDGVSDDREALQRSIDEAADVLDIPEGHYKIGGTLRVPSGKWLRFHERATIKLADGAGTGQEVFLLANANPVEGNEGIRVEGGIWDGNNRANPRGGDSAGQYTGVSINFINVRNLDVHSLRLVDAETYFIRLSKTRGFSLSNIHFSTTNPRPNQDGIHVAGECHDGDICNIRGEGASATKDDLVALVADDALARAQNLGLCCGPISKVRVADLNADDCHSFVRLASVHNHIEDVMVERVSGGCEACAVNMDALRYCAFPLFEAGDSAFADGAGFCRNITLKDFRIFRSKSHLANPLVLLETIVEEFRMENFVREFKKDVAPEIPTLRIAEMKAGDVRFLGIGGAEADRLLANGASHFQRLAGAENGKFSLHGSLASSQSLVSFAEEFGEVVLNCRS